MKVQKFVSIVTNKYVMTLVLLIVLLLIALYHVPGSISDLRPSKLTNKIFPFKLARI